MKFTDRPKWKRILLAGICLIGLLAVVGNSFAAYTSQAFQRGVARNRDNKTIRFTSNYLQNCDQAAQENAYTGKTVLFSEEQKKAETLQIDIKIYNYANGNTNLVSQKDITYDLTIKLSGGKGTNYTVKRGDQDAAFSDGLYTFSNQTLPGRKANSYTYTVTFSGSDLDDLKITAAATPTLLSVTNNQKLAAVIAPCVGSTTQTFAAEGRFTDESASPGEYDGFNYEISISSGTAKATLTWDELILEIDRFFLKKLGKKDQEIAQILEKGSLTLEMSQEDGTGDYLIPFYIKDKDNIPADWNGEDGMEKKISFTAEQITQQHKSRLDDTEPEVTSGSRS